MEPNKKREIEALAEVVRKNYLESRQINWERLADDNNIFYFIDSRFFVPIAIATDTYRLVAVSPLKRANYGMDLTAHEFGHVLLDHLNPKSSLSETIKEEEATHFAYALVGKVENDYSSTLFQRILAEMKYPLASYLSTSGNRDKWSKYVLSFVRNEAIKELKRRVRVEPI